MRDISVSFLEGRIKKENPLPRLRSSSARGFLFSISDRDQITRRHHQSAWTGSRAPGKDETWVSAMLRILTLPVHLAREFGTSQLSLSWESVARIARLSDAALQEELVAALLSGATHKEVSMDQLTNFADSRLLQGCVYCGAPDARDAPIMCRRASYSIRRLPRTCPWYCRA